jgi:hypothetical protein
MSSLSPIYYLVAQLYASSGNWQEPPQLKEETVHSVAN